VTSAQVLSGETNEGVLLEEMIEDDRTKGIKSECVVADGLYDNIGTYDLQDFFETPIYTPCRHGLKDMEKHYFFKDNEGYFKCRNYCTGKHELLYDGRHLYEFNPAECSECLSKGSCVPKGEANRRVVISKCYDKLLSQKAWLRKEALEKRKRIEAKFGEAKKWHGLARARYRGKGKVLIQSLMTFFVINAKRTVKLMEKIHAPPGVFDNSLAVNWAK
jgi:hypothetical protein